MEVKSFEFDIASANELDSYAGQSGPSQKSFTYSFGIMVWPILRKPLCISIHLLRLTVKYRFTVSGRSLGAFGIATEQSF